MECRLSSWMMARSRAQLMEVEYHNLGMQIWLVIKKLLVVVRAPIPIPIPYMLHPKMDRRYEPCFV